MKKAIVTGIVFILLFLVSCATKPLSPEGTQPSNKDTTTDTDITPAVDMDLSVRAFTTRMYEQALPPSDDETSPIPEAPGSLKPVEMLPHVGEGVVGSTVILSLTDSPNNLFWLMQESSNGSHTTVTIVTANGDSTRVEEPFQPLCIVLDVTADDSKRFREDPSAVTGVIRSVCFLDGNEYWFVNNGTAALMKNPQEADAEAKLAFGSVQTGGELWLIPHDGQTASIALQEVYERIHTRFAVEIP